MLKRTTEEESYRAKHNLNRLIKLAENYDSDNLEEVKLLTLLSMPESVFDAEIFKIIAKWKIPDAFDERLIIKISEISDVAFPDWVSCKLFGNVSGPEIMDLRTIHRTAFYKQKSHHLNSGFPTGHNILSDLVVDYSASHQRKNYVVDQKDLIHKCYGLKSLNWIKKNQRNLPERLINWFNGGRLCGWADVVLGCDNRIYVPFVTVSDTSDIGWFDLDGTMDVLFAGLSQ